MPTPPSDPETLEIKRGPGPLKLGVLVSGGGTTLDNLARRIEAGVLDTEVVQVVVSNEKAGGIGVARRHGVPCEVIRRRDHASTEAFSDEVFALLRGRGVNVVCLAGFLSLLRIPDDFAWRVLNIHPALLPSFGGKGMYGQRVHQAVLDAGAKLSGCTVHFADNTYDTGPILLQRCCPVEPGDTAQTLAARVFAEECEAYPAVLSALGEGRVRRSGDIAWVTE